jgi:H+/Na+-translocating ferredoxin:NAD+ oxidoreductase subunit G
MDERKGNLILTLLAGAAVVAIAAAIVEASHDFSKGRIAANERARLSRSLSSVLDPAIRGHDLRTVRLAASDELLGDDGPVDVFVAVDAGQPAAAIFATVAPHGYNAEIRTLIGISPAGTITGVRVVSHRETPGLGDAIDVAKGPWITRFDGTSLAMPARELWAVDKDEGAFDTITGATVTSRALVKAVKDTLLYFEQHRDELFREAAASAPPDDAAKN